jgi:hypothetical protein
MRTHRYTVGQHVSYAEDYSPTRIWLRGYEIVSLLPAGDREPQYQIRSDGQSYDQVVWESQLQAFGRRTMRLNKHAMRTTTALASPDRRAHRNRNDQKKPNQYQDLTRWDDEGGAPRSGHHVSESPPSRPEAETALYYFNVRTESSLIGDPEGNRYPNLQAVRDAAIAMARDMIVEGDQQGEDRRGWHVEVVNRANQQVLTVAFAEVLGPEAAA